MSEKNKFNPFVSLSAMAGLPKYAPGMGRILFDGTIVLPSKTPDTNAGN